MRPGALDEVGGQDGRLRPTASARRTSNPAAPPPTNGPGWLSAWSKSTVASAPIHDQQMKDFTAKPLPATSASRWSNNSNDSTTHTVATTAGGNPAPGPAPTEAGSLLAAFSRTFGGTSGAGGSSPGSTSVQRNISSGRMLRSSSTGRTSTSGVAPAQPSTAPSPPPGQPGATRRAAAQSVPGPNPSPGRVSSNGAGPLRPSSSFGYRQSLPGSLTVDQPAPARGSYSPSGATGLNSSPARPMRGRTVTYNGSTSSPSRPGTSPGTGAVSTTGTWQPGALTAAPPSPSMLRPGSSKYRGPRASLQQAGAGIDLDESSVVPDEPSMLGGIIAGSTGGVVGGLFDTGGGGGGGAGDVPQHHVGLAQHILMSGSLQEMHDRYFAKVERNVHLSLASVVFAGDLDPAASDTIRISNRAVVLHNCTFALKPGQRLWVGSNAQLLLSEVHVVTAAANTQQQPGGAVTAGVPVGPGVASSGYGQARPQQQHLLQRQSSGRLGGGAATNGGGPVPVIETAALRLVRVLAHSGSHPGSPRRFTADESGFGSALTAGSAAGGGPVSPLIHVAGGGRLVMRNCRVQVVAPQGEAAGQGAGLGGGAMTGPVPPASPRTAAIAARAAAASGQTPGTSLGAARGSTGGSGGDKSGRPPLTQVVAILAEGGGIVEGVGCRLGRIHASGEGTRVQLLRCRITPGDAPAPDAPLVLATAGASVLFSHVDVREGPAYGIVVQGQGSKLAASESAVYTCRWHGVVCAEGATAAFSASRLSGNAGAGLCATGGGVCVELQDCEMAGNQGSNVVADSGACVARMSNCMLSGSAGGSGLCVIGPGSRATAESCSLDGNAVCGVVARRGASAELQDCSCSGNTIHGVEVEGILRSADAAAIAAAAALTPASPTAADTVACSSPRSPSLSRQPAYPSPEAYVTIIGGQLAKNGKHGCSVVAGGGVKVANCELSQNGEDGICVEGGGCEARVRSCTLAGNVESGLFVCSAGAAAVEGCRLSGNLHGDAAVGGRHSRARLTRCTFEFNPVTALRAHMGARVELLGCAIEPPPTTGAYGTLTSSSSSEPSGWPEPWEIGGVSSRSVHLFGEGSRLVVDGQVFKSQLGELEGELMVPSPPPRRIRH